MFVVVFNHYWAVINFNLKKRFWLVLFCLCYNWSSYFLYYLTQKSCSQTQQLNLRLSSARVSAGSPDILSSSKCTVRSDRLTCVCISQGSTVPSIKWPILKNLTEYSVSTSVSGHTVSSTLVLAAQEKSIAKVQCNSGKLKKHLIISKGTEQNRPQHFSSQLSVSLDLSNKWDLNEMFLSF